MNEAANPKPARCTGGVRFVSQLGSNPIAPGATHFFCQPIDGLPELRFELDRCPMRRTNMSKADVWEDLHLVSTAEQIFFPLV